MSPEAQARLTLLQAQHDRLMADLKEEASKEAHVQFAVGDKVRPRVGARWVAGHDFVWKEHGFGTDSEPIGTITSVSWDNLTIRVASRSGSSHHTVNALPPSMEKVK